jgi:hypothetical protein
MSWTKNLKIVVERYIKDPAAREATKAVLGSYYAQRLVTLGKNLDDPELRGALIAGPIAFRSALLISNSFWAKNHGMIVPVLALADIKLVHASGHMATADTHAKGTPQHVKSMGDALACIDFVYDIPVFMLMLESGFEVANDQGASFRKDILGVFEP